MKKFIIVKLNGSKDNTVSDPKIIGIMYKVRKRLFKYFSAIN